MNSLERDQDVELIQDAAAKSRKGRNAMRHVVAWLDDDGIALDLENREAILQILSAAWGSFAGTARDLMREALDEVGK